MKAFGKLVVIVATIFLVAQVGFVVIPRIVYPIRYADMVTKAESDHHVPRNVILAVMREESHFNPSSTSGAGAVGLMQLLPDTAEWIAGQRHSEYSKATLSSPEINIDYGTWYIHYLTEQLHNDTLALEAYNAGITNVLEWERNKPGYVAFAETDQFVKRVKNSRTMYDKLYGAQWERK